MTSKAQTSHLSPSLEVIEGYGPSPKKLSELRVLKMPRGGIDRLSFTTWDTIDVPGIGEDTFRLQGYYVIERANPTSSDWQEGSVEIFMRELAVTGVSEKFGRVNVTVNNVADKQSGGHVRPGTKFPGIEDAPKLCEMDGYMLFALPDAGISVFNKEPIRLQHYITHIPPVGQGGGTQGRVEIKLYRVDDPNGQPVATLREVRTNIGAWLVE